jgi:hypothetical protein
MAKKRSDAVRLSMRDEIAIRLTAPQAPSSRRFDLAFWLVIEMRSACIFICCSTTWTKGLLGPRK